MQADSRGLRESNSKKSFPVGSRKKQEELIRNCSKKPHVLQLAEALSLLERKDILEVCSKKLLH